MDRHLAFALTCLETIASFSGSCSRAPSQAGSDHVDGTATEKSIGDSIDDATLTASVKPGLAFGRGVKASTITVHTDQGTVTLTGKVGSEAERELAARIAREIEGVHDVVNLLEVRG